MRKRIKQLARGKFEYAKPVLSFSEEEITVEVIENSDFTGCFTIASENNIPIRGIIYTDNPRMECLTPQFDGEEVRVRYRFHGNGLLEGDQQKGEFVIVCNEEEYSLSFCAIISKLYPDSSIGTLKSLYDFSNLAKEHWEEAYQLFYHKSFSNIIKPKEVKEAMLYRGIVSAKPSDQNLEEFLVGIHKKNKVGFSIEKQEYLYKEIVESSKETIEIVKDGWGYLSLNVTTDADFLQLSKERITTLDFLGSSCPFEYYLTYDKLHAGKNFGTICFSGVYQTITVKITVIKEPETPKDAEADKLRRQIGECKVGLMELYQAYRLKRIVTGVWANETIDILNHLHAIEPDEPMYELMKAQAFIINRQRQEAEWILNAFKRNWEDKKAPIWGYYLYIMTLMEREPTYVDRMTHEIELIFHENPDSVLLFWVLSFLEEEYFNNSAGKLKAIEYWVMQGCNSPYLYLEACYLIWQDPYLLTKLETFEIRVLRWALRRHALTKDVAAQIFEIVEMGKGFDPVLYSLLSSAYEVNPQPANLGIICSYLIRGQQFDPKYHYWFEEGIELELRITGLYEAYLLSMDEREVISVPKIIQMYFQYNSTLPYRKIAVLYNNIVASKETNPQVYHKYRKVMGRFTMEQLVQGHMDDNLAVLYKDMLDLGMVNEELAHALAKVIFMHKLILFQPGMVRAFVYQRQMKEPQIVPIMEQIAYFPLYSKEYMIIFEDAKGRRYVNSIEYQLQNLMEPNAYLETCLALAPNELPYLVSYFTTKRNYLTFTEDDKQYFEQMLFSEELSREYRAELAPEIIRFCQTTGSEELVQQYLGRLEISKMMPAARRYMIELMVENHMYDKVFELIGIYGMDEIGAAYKVSLSSYMIRKRNYEEDEYLMVLVEQGFLSGKYNDVMLDYMSRYYNGPTETMRDLWVAAHKFDVDTFELEERLLTQMLYTGGNLPEADAVFDHYYENGGRELIVMAYLSCCARAYFLEEAKQDNVLFERIESRYRYHMELNDTCKLAMLKHLSELAERSEIQYQIQDELLSEFTCRNIYFAFYKRLDKRLVLKYHLYDKVFLEYRAKPHKRIVLHYSRDEDGENFTAEEMMEAYEGIFVKAFVMFFGDTVRYYISEEYGGQVEVAESSRISNNDVYGEKNESRYSLINQMLISNTLYEEDSLLHDMMQYAGYEEVTKKVFHLL